MVLLNMMAEAVYDSRKAADETNSPKELFRTPKNNHTTAISELKIRLIKLVYTNLPIARIYGEMRIHITLRRNAVVYQPERSFERRLNTRVLNVPLIGNEHFFSLS